MPGKRGAKAREQGLERTDNEMEFTSWPQVMPINQKNYYTEFLKRDDQILALRLQNEESRNRMAKAHRDKDRAMAQGGPDVDIDGDDVAMGDDGAAPDADSTGSKVIVIHPGSQNLRIGLASDALPRTVSMCIARKAPANESEGANVPPRPPRNIEDASDSPSEGSHLFGAEFTSYFTSMSAELKARMRKKGRRIVPNCKEVAISFNRKTGPTTVNEHNDVSRIDWTEPTAEGQKPPEYYVGQAALRIPDDSNPRYKLSWPMRYGAFNEVDYQSRSEIFNDFALILEDAIKNQLGLTQKSEWSQYGCVFVIPDLYERAYVTEILDILVRELNFGRVCFLQESLAGSFGAGYPAAVIVDVGAQKTSICCVDEGMCIENSRINLRYGGSDVTDTFIKMLLQDQFPYSEINLKRRHDFLLAEELKQKFCTLSIQEFTAQQYEFFLRVFGQDTRHYLFKAYDEVILSPMVLFRPEIFDLAEKKNGKRRLIARSTDLYDGAPNDPISAAQMHVLNDSPQDPNEPEPATGTNGDSMEVQADAASRPQQASVKPDDAPNGTTHDSPRPEDIGTPQPAADGTPLPGANGTDNAATNDPLHPLMDLVHNAEARDRKTACVSLSQAIMLSIEQGARGDDRKMKDFLGSILPTGGGTLIPAFRAFLEEELAETQPRFRKEILVAPPPREIDPQVLVWKGASVWGKLKNNDSWISGLEYDRMGSRALTYKCMWNW